MKYLPIDKTLMIGHMHAHIADEIMFESRLREYHRLFSLLNLLPLENQEILDAGCGSGKWLSICCHRWGAQEKNCKGSDKRKEVWDRWFVANANTQITFVNALTHELAFSPSSFDIVHQSMMLSSITDGATRTKTAQVLWRLLRPGGLLISYDFWLNPFNPRTVGIGYRQLRTLFPGGKLAFSRDITLAPPLCRALARISKSAVLGLEKARVLNTHQLIALRRPS